MSLKPGTTIGDYRVVKKLGEGGMGEVYLAVHEVLGQKVVLKGLHDEFWRSRELGDRLAREAAAMARLTHPNIVTIYNFLQTSEGAYIVMEYVEGATFEDLIRRMGLVPPARAIELILPVLRAVDYAHRQGVIDRDLKPSNVMLGFEGQVRVLDFGTAKLVDQPGLTRVGTTLGTATYMPPEQLMGGELTPATDIYAIGVTLYEMCTGRLPFESEDTRSLFKKIHAEAPLPPSVHYPPLAGAFERVILKCLAKRPRDRYQSAAELAEALQEVAAELQPPAPEPAPAAAPGAQPRPARKARSQPGPIAIGATAAAGAGLFGVLGGSALLFAGKAAAGVALVWGAALVWGIATAVLALLVWLAREAAAAGTGSQPFAAVPPPAPGAPADYAPAGLRRSGAPTLASAVVPAADYDRPAPARSVPREVVWRHAPFDPAAIAPEAAPPALEEEVVEEAGPGERTIIAPRPDRLGEDAHLPAA